MMLLFFLFFCLSCSTNVLKPPYKANIVVLKNGEYVWDVVEFQTLRDIKKMDGDYAAILADGMFYLEGDKGVSFEYKNFSLDYFVKNGVIYPKNFDSLCALSLYYHYEFIVNFWKENVHEKIFEIIGKKNIFYQPSYKKKDQSYLYTTRHNAYYSSDFDAFSFFEANYNFENIDFSLSLGVLAHEFGHLVFNRFAEKRDPLFYTKNPERSIFFLKSLNEGLADFFSWVVIGGLSDFQYVSHDLKSRMPPSKWTSDEIADKDHFYAYGTVLFSVFYELVTIHKMDPLEISKRLLKTMDSFYDRWLLSEDEYSGEYIFLSEYLKHGDKKQECAVFLKWYTDILNKTEIEKSCQNQAI